MLEFINCLWVNQDSPTKSVLLECKGWFSAYSILDSTGFHVHMWLEPRWDESGLIMYRNAETLLAWIHSKLLGFHLRRSLEICFKWHSIFSSACLLKPLPVPCSRCNTYTLPGGQSDKHRVWFIASFVPTQLYESHIHEANDPFLALLQNSKCSSQMAVQLQPHQQAGVFIHPTKEMSASLWNVSMAFLMMTIPRFMQLEIYMQKTILLGKEWMFFSWPSILRNDMQLYPIFKENTFIYAFNQLLKTHLLSTTHCVCLCGRCWGYGNK